ARRHKLILIEDAAHSLGASYKGKPVGGIADMTMFSFHPVKSITTGEGGAVTTNNKIWHEKMLMFRSHGITKDQQQFVHKSPGEWYHEMQMLGLNYRMTEIQAALGLSQLKKLPRFLKARRVIVARYQKEFGKIPELIVPKEPEKYISSWHLFPVRVKDSATRAEIFAKLRRAGIGVQVHFIPVYWHPYYQELGYKKGLCPHAEHFYETEISLPVFPGLSRAQQDYVITRVKKCIA
ncbi:MAG: Bacillosamine/Legionaminic acid biosynthesis aminotransferase PglE, partial [Parcubacteria group bacterium Gr01-1014_66]